MKKVLWQTRSQVVADAIHSGTLPDMANGGNAYDFHAYQVLREKFDMQLDETAVLKKKDSFRSYWWRMAHHQPHGDVVIAEPSPVVFGKRNRKIKTVAMIHHIDDDLARSSVKHGWFFNRLKKRLPEMDLVITVSDFWKNYLQALGCKRIRIIHNAFHPGDYVVPPEQVDTFRKKIGLKKDQPLVYIGNAHKQKGAPQVYEALKDKNYKLVMTGKTNHVPEIPVQFLSLNRDEFIVLLAASDVVVTFSSMTEGWNRIAHESMLCGTPVIGSGTGGMKELLDGGGQTTVTQPAELAGAVERVLAERKRFAASGLEYVKKFDLQYFRNAWLKAIDELV